MNNRTFPSMTALLALLAIAGYQNRDKISEMLRGATQPGQPGEPSAPEDGNSAANSGGSGGLGGLLGSLGGLFGGASTGGSLQDGLSELVDRFRQNGHGETADSWVKTGPNQQIDDQSLEHALGPDVLETLAEKTGLSREELLARLSRELPQAVDSYTPEGRLGTT
ncbi:YidB family protein [Bosea sp. 117]|uniref:YidB family protein n=1 Tax=Bosea sp. 117 TaxID=1125973 RepID=UPI000494C691|nr:YidB family protein [Bosea sp. 117]